MTETRPDPSVDEILAEIEEKEQLLREGATVLDEPFHHDAIACTMCGAADLLAAAARALRTQQGKQDERNPDNVETAKRERYIKELREDRDQLLERVRRTEQLTADDYVVTVTSSPRTGSSDD